jgi:kynureninase
MKFENTLAFAKALDKQDPLNVYRKQFYIPKVNGKEAIYLCGNSLGLQPKSVEKHIKTELEDWRDLGVEGHLHARNPWLYYHHQFEKPLCNLLGAKKTEVVAMNQLTVNLNLMLVSFYQPKGKKRKIILEASAFPSDYYAVEQQIRYRGLDPNDCILELTPRAGEVTLRTEDILQTIQKNKEEVALILLGAVNYYSGQLFDLKKIGEAACEHKIVYGLDLAHAIGNVELKLHDWNVDFATWCSYKYLNSGPGGVSGVFVHEHHAKDKSLPRFAGWWGNDERTRFKMQKHFVPQEGAQGWQMSNAPVLSMAAHKASLEIFEQAGLKNIRKKSEQMTQYLEYLLNSELRTSNSQLKIITPQNLKERGCQFSFQTKSDGKKIFDKLTKAGVIADWREPDVIRIAPAPLYNSFEDVYRFSQLLLEAIH